MKRVYTQLGSAVVLTHPKPYESVLDELNSVTKQELKNLGLIPNGRTTYKQHSMDYPSSTGSDISPAHGLFSDEPLVVEKIIRSCYANPHRQRFPGFQSHGKGDFANQLYTKSDTADSLIKKINSKLPMAVQKFNKAKYSLHNTSMLYEKQKYGSHQDAPVDQILYLKSIGSCKWYGPYVNRSFEGLIFYSINDTGDNSYHAKFGVYMDSNYPGSVGLMLSMDDSDIAPTISHSQA